MTTTDDMREVSATAAGNWDEIRGAVVEARDTIKRLEMADAQREADAVIENDGKEDES